MSLSGNSAFWKKPAPGIAVESRPGIWCFDSQCRRSGKADFQGFFAMTVTRRSFLAATALMAGAILGPGTSQAAEVKIATEGTYKPFSYFTAGSELTGFDVELTLAICEAAGLACVMVTMDNDAVLPALKDGKVDAIATGMSVTEKRKKIVAFTER